MEMLRLEHRNAKKKKKRPNSRFLSSDSEIKCLHTSR